MRGFVGSCESTWRQGQPRPLRLYLFPLDWRAASRSRLWIRSRAPGLKGFVPGIFQQIGGTNEAECTSFGLGSGFGKLMHLLLGRSCPVDSCQAASLLLNLVMLAVAVSVVLHGAGRWGKELPGRACWTTCGEVTGGWNGLILDVSLFTLNSLHPHITCFLQKIPLPRVYPTSKIQAQILELNITILTFNASLGINHHGLPQQRGQAVPARLEQAD